jgi:hypothetical protein
MGLEILKISRCKIKLVYLRTATFPGVLTAVYCPSPPGLFGQKPHLSKTLLKSRVFGQSRRDQSNSLALSLLPLSQPDPWAATVLVDKLYAGRF